MADLMKLFGKLDKLTAREGMQTGEWSLTHTPAGWHLMAVVGPRRECGPSSSPTGVIEDFLAQLVVEAEKSAKDVEARAAEARRAATAMRQKVEAL
jgi:hypothetical protein